LMGAQAVRLSNVDIDKALENRDFEVRFQPIFDLGNGALARMETFVRWRHPSLGVLPPGAFLSFFETQGRMSELTRYVLAEALDGYLGWRGPFEPGFSINLALTDVSDDAFARHFKKILRDRDFPADLVTLECPMPLVDVDMQAAAENFASLRECGARLAIEVRGRANDFLRNIDPFPFDEIKTGGASILRFARTVRGPGLSAISDLLDIANKANALITAVGVEDQASLAALRGLGFTAAQGNHLAKVGDLNDFRPGRVNEVRELLGLATLSAEDLTALFRTEAPALKTGDADAAPSEGDDETGTLIERLQAHTEKQAARAAAAADAADDSADGDGADQEKMTPAQQVMREKAKAVALAKRAKAREIRKAAAIKRAKAKAAKTQAEAAEQSAGAPASDAPDTALPPSAAPRALQDRLAQEYTADSSQVEDELFDAPESAPPAPVQEAKDNNDAVADASSLSVDEQIGDQPDELQFDASAAAEEAPIPDEQPAPAALENDADGLISLHVDAPSAHFRPVTRVSGDAHINQPQPHAAATRPNDAINVVPPDLRQQETQQFSFEEELYFEELPASLEGSAPHPEPEAAPEAEPAPEPSEPPSDTIVQGHLEEEHTLDVAPAQKPRRKNLLTRRYKVVPTHFWPKPWKRRFVRWQKQRAAVETPHAEAAE
jgi:EAL domain-containing protein (putative c-di-GMP-specific phosphodiesterase class I)